MKFSWWSFIAGEAFILLVMVVTYLLTGGLK